MEAGILIGELDRRFGIPGVASVKPGNGGLPKVVITSPSASGEVYLHGSQVTSWQPRGVGEILFLSPNSRWEEGIAIRGGIPVCFPWFRGKADDPKAPAHGFVRTRAWQLESISRAGDRVTVSMSTEGDEDTKGWWPHDFRLALNTTFGPELTLRLVVTNTGSQRLRFEEALHTYYKVGQVEAARVRGLDGVPYLDNTDGNVEKKQDGDVTISCQTDRAYMGTQGEIELHDPSLHRRIRLQKEGSLTTVVWNPWVDGARALSDLGDDQWRKMLCVEASNILGCAVTVAPAQHHAMKATIGILPLA